MKLCWKCKDDEVYDFFDNNGLCYNCYAECKEANEKARYENFEDGEPH